MNSVADLSQVFAEGIQLYALWWADGDEIVVGEDSVESITITTNYTGDRTDVYAAVVGDGYTSFHNMKHIMGFRLLED